MAGLLAPMALAAAGAVAAAGGSGAAGVTVPLEIREEVLRYRVPGDDLEDLRAALRSQSVSDRSGGSHGRTHSALGIEYTPMPVEGGCRAHDPSIRLEITTTLPEWDPATRVGAALRERWQAVAAALQRHEGTHREHALAAARDLQAAMGRLGVQPDCAALRREADRAVMRVTLRAEFLDARYDERTRNGLEEGIVL
ncbi:MAG TPA: DUF922 domain-containing protein [Xanthomonadaceae bacterium]|nr:DUF922 domain-containing protein [Xanthomonadaceae bacterium]